MLVYEAFPIALTTERILLKNCTSRLGRGYCSFSLLANFERNYAFNVECSFCRSQTLRNQAKLVVTEMEAAATMQLQGLANQSEATIASLQRKLDKARERIEEFQSLVRTFVEELLMRTRTAQRRKNELEEKQWKETSPTAVKEARSKACSILNISSADLESIMEESSGHREAEMRLRTEQETAWMNEVESVMKRQGTFAVPLLEVLLDLVDERVAIESKYAGQ